MLTAIRRASSMVSSFACGVAAFVARVHSLRMANSRKPCKYAASVHFDQALWNKVTELAARERRPISQLLRILVADAVDGRCDRGQPAGGMEAA
jgi:hypothetical protein